MQFKEGSAVEVLRRREQCDSWFPGKIISADRCEYTVRYERFLNCEGNHIIEEVHEENVRPQPPNVKGGKRWVLGDEAEVFDLHSWRVGKVAKVLNNDRFVIRLFGSIQLKEFHRSDLRLRQSWEDNKWIVIGKVDGNKPINNNLTRSRLKYSQGLGCGGLQKGICKEIHTRQRGRHLKNFSSMTSLKGNQAFHFRSSLDDAVMRRVGKERETMEKAGQSNIWPRRTPPLLKQLDASSSPKREVIKKCMTGSKKDIELEKTNNHSLHPFSMLARATEESNECSVASCSSNDFPEYTTKNFQKSSWNITSNSFNDAESLCASDPGRTYLPSCAEDKFEAHVHQLELHAYKSTVQAMYASGPLSWEQESLLTNLRLFLHISNDEHLLQLKHLLSAEVP